MGLLDCAERPTSSLSGGQKQRVVIAGALAESPRVLLLDELTTFLDYEDQLNVLQCVRSIVDSGEPVGDSSSSSGSESGSESEGEGIGTDGALVRRRGISSSDGLFHGTAAAVAAPAAAGANVARPEQQQRRRAGVTALWVTHRLEELEFADSVSFMEGGRISFSGSPREMRGHLRSLGAKV